MEIIAISIKDTRRVFGGIGTTLVYKMIKDGRLEKIKLGTRSLITMASIKKTAAEMGVEL